jgi:hypothetical protein
MGARERQVADTFAASCPWETREPADRRAVERFRLGSLAGKLPYRDSLAQRWPTGGPRLDLLRPPPSLRFIFKNLNLTTVMT